MAKKPLKEADLVKQLKDATKGTGDDPPKVVVVKGFLGKTTVTVNGAAKERWRVYLNHALTDYYEIEDSDDILHWIDVGDEDEGQRIWLRHGAKTRLVRTRASEARVPNLLGGRIAQTLIPVAQATPPRWEPGQAGYPIQPAAADWLPFGDEPGWEVTVCRKDCYSASP